MLTPQGIELLDIAKKGFEDKERLNKLPFPKNKLERVTTQSASSTKLSTKNFKSHWGKHEIKNVSLCRR